MRGGEEVFERLGAQIAFAPMPHGNLTALRFPVAHHQHVRYFLELRFANLQIHLFRAVVEMNAEPGVG